MSETPRNTHFWYRERSDMAFFINTWIKFFVLLTPFFALSMFVLYTANMSRQERKRLALRVTSAVLVISLVLFFLGNAIFAVVGITIDSFRVGAGALLFLSAVSLVQGTSTNSTPGEDIAVVPLAVPIIVGPATTGALLIMGAEITEPHKRYLALGALLLSILSIGGMLLAASWIEKIIRHRGIVILSKLTGLVLAALASQMVFEGAKHLISR